MTNRTKKYLAIVAGVVVLVMLTLAVLAKMLITPERIKMALIPRAEQVLDRPVEIGDVDISLFSGIVVRELTIREKSTEAVFLSAGEVSLQYQFWPLLRKRVVVDEVMLKQPQIRVERLADGSFNFSDLLAAKEEAEPPTPPAEPEEKRDIDLLISTIALRDGTVAIVDHKVAAGEPFRYQVRDLNLQVDELSLEEDFPLRLEALLGEAPLTLSGKANLQSKTVQAGLSLNGFDVIPFKPYFREQLPGKLESMLVNLKVNLAGDAQRLVSEGQIDLSNIDLQLDALPDAPLKNARLGAEYSLKLDQPAATLELPKGRVTLNGIPLNLAGKVTDFPAASKVDLALHLPNLDLQQAVAALPGELKRSLAKLDPAGSLDARLHLAGPLVEPKSLLRNGEIRLDEVQGNLAGQRSAVSGLISLQGDNLSAPDLALVVGQNRARLDLEVRNFTAKPIAVTTALTAQRFNLDSLLQKGDVAGGETPAGGPPADSRPKAPEKEEIGPFDLPVRVSGTAAISQALYKGLTIEQLRARYRLENNILLLDELTGNVAGGSFRETARVDLGKKGLEYTARLNLSDIRANPLVSAFFPKAAGTVFGGLDLDLDLAGKGTRPEAIRQALTAKGDILLEEGKLTGAGLAQGLANFLDLGELRELNFDQAKGRFAVNNGKIALDSDLAGSKLQLTPKGTVGLDGALDLDLGLRLSPELVEKLSRGGKFPSLLKDEKGWGRIPLNVAGTASSPRFAVDSSAFKAMAEEKAREKLQKTLQEKLFDKKKEGASKEAAPEEQAEQEPRQPAEKLLEGVFKGLFGD